MIRGATRRRKTNRERALISKLARTHVHTPAQWGKNLCLLQSFVFTGRQCPLSAGGREEEWPPNNASSGRNISPQQRHHCVTAPPCATLKSLCCCRCAQQIFSLLGSTLQCHDEKKMETERKKTLLSRPKRPQITSAAFCWGWGEKKKRNFARRLKRTNLRGGEVGELGASRLQLQERKRWLGAAAPHCVGSLKILRKDSYKIKDHENLH